MLEQYLNTKAKFFTNVPSSLQIYGYISLTIFKWLKPHLSHIIYFQDQSRSLKPVVFQTFFCRPYDLSVDKYF